MGSRFNFLPYGDRQPYRCESPYTAAVCKRRKGETGRKEEEQKEKRKRRRRKKKKKMMMKMGWPARCIDAPRCAVEAGRKGGWKDRAMGRRGGG